MYTTKQQAINHYLENMNSNLDHNINKVEDVVWVNADKIMAVLQEHALLKNAFGDAVEVKLPPMVEADWDTNKRIRQASLLDPRKRAHDTSLIDSLIRDNALKENSVISTAAPIGLSCFLNRTINVPTFSESASYSGRV